MVSVWEKSTWSKGYCFLNKILRNHLLSEHMRWNCASFKVKSNRLMSTSSKKSYQTAEILYTWPLIPSSFSPLKQSHIHLKHDHGTFCHCMTSTLTLNNWGQKYCQTLGYKPNPSIPQCDLIQCFILPTIKKYSLLLKLKQHIKQLRMDTKTQKIGRLNDNIISKNRAISCNMIFEMSFLMNAFL